MVKKYLNQRLFSLTIVLVLIITFFSTSIYSLNVWTPYERYIPQETPIAKRHLRGTWITTVLNLDWPSAEVRDITDDKKRIRRSKEELVELLDIAVEMNLNAVFFQVSPEADAFYKSDIVPWSRYLTGTFGKDPGFDPLQFAIDESHKRNLELHAWFNPYRVSMNTTNETKAALNINKSVYKENPEWIKTSMNRFVVDPGIPGAINWVIRRVMEVVENYDVDGVHFDDYFYYERIEGELNDEGTFNKYNNGQFKNIGDWRRNNVYLLIEELSRTINLAKPWVKFGISPAGVWGNKEDGHPDGSNTQSSFTNYDRSFADTKKWVEDEIIDYIAPQIYFTFANPRASYGEVANWWSNVVRDKNVHLYIGQALYKVNSDSDQYFNGEKGIREFTSQLKYNIEKPEVLGSIMFRTEHLTEDKKQPVVNIMKNNIWPTKALVPIMEWKGGVTPGRPILGNLEQISGNAKISWMDNFNETAYFAIYRFSESENINITSESSAKNLIATVRKTKNGIQEFIDKGIKDINNTVYVVTALDRLHNESPGLIITISLSSYFPDVPKGYFWAKQAVDELHERGVVVGDNHGRFNPGANIKRGDYILMITNAFGFESEFENNFADVSKGSYYYNAIGIAKALGIVKGDGYNFNPDANITREDIMVITHNALKKQEIEFAVNVDEILDNYTDEKLISIYARESVANLTSMGSVRGYNEKINPKGSATRAEATTIIYNVLNNTK